MIRPQSDLHFDRNKTCIILTRISNDSFSRNSFLAYSGLKQVQQSQPFLKARIAVRFMGHINNCFFVYQFGDFVLFGQSQ